ncbi:MAG: S-methyl-5-thioribose-1-phosphate isomerase [Synergistaceae bacterium]|nr:S-methyl-5-thioribose-1-phosphate isomerase [Synergistaceae bacterium]
MIPRAIEWISNKRVLRLLDQRCLPYEIKYIDCNKYSDVVTAIENMTVRGAPAIGIAAAYGVLLSSYTNNKSYIENAIYSLSKTRPTAVNLHWSLDRMSKIFYENQNNKKIYEIFEKEADKIYKEDIEINKTLSNYGQELLPPCATVITHCNAGSYATAGYGTALGVIRAAKENNKTISVFISETRPRLQGGLITSFELYEEGFDITVICDSMAAFLMSTQRIDAVIVGADRVASNGDVANKIGTYSLAIVAKEHKVPFYVAAPTSTFDLNCPEGKCISIELRSSDEVRKMNNKTVIPERIPVWNPSFDITPAHLITSIITERGVISSPFEDKIYNNK